MIASALNAFLKIKVDELEGGRVRLSMRAGPEWRNEMGLIHGGAPTILLDGAGGRAAIRALKPGEACATVHLSVQFLAGASEGMLAAEAWVVKRGRNIAFIEAECRDEAGAMVATATGTWVIRQADGRSGPA